MNQSMPSSDVVVSVIVPACNRLELLRETLDSVQRQTLGQHETIVVDDGSAPAAAAEIDRLAGPRVRIIHQTNQGLSAARNTGLAHARGRFIQFLDSDDLLQPTKLAHDVEFLTRHPEIDLVSGGALRFCGSVRCSRPVESIWPFVELFPALLAGNPMPVHAPLVRRTALPSEMRFDRALRAAEDWDFWLALAARGLRAAFVPGARVAYRFHPNQMSADSSRMLQNVEQVLAYGRTLAASRADAASLLLPLIAGHAAWAVRARAADLEDDAAALGKHVTGWLAGLPAGAPHPDFPPARLLETWTHVGLVVAHDPPLLRDAAGRWQQALEHWTARPDANGLRILLGSGRMLHQSGVDELQRLADLARRAALTAHDRICGIRRSRGHGAHVEAVQDDLSRCGVQRLLLFGAGAHTDWLLADFDWRGFNLVALVDDDPRLWGTRVLDAPVVSIRDAAHLAADAILISSDAHEARLVERAALMLPDLPVFRLYAPAPRPEPVAPH